MPPDIFAVCLMLFLFQVLAAFASIAENCEAEFVKYYDHIVPYLKQLLSQPPADKQDRMLRAKAMECITLIGV